MTTVVLKDEAPPPREAEKKPNPTAVPTAELADCCCPDFCERDHGNE